MRTEVRWLLHRGFAAGGVHRARFWATSAVEVEVSGMDRGVAAVEPLPMGCHACGP